MTAITPTIQTFAPPSMSQINRGAQINSSLSQTATLISGKAAHRVFDKNYTGIQIDNESLSTFPISESASALSLMLSHAASTTSTVSPLTAQSTSPNPKVPSLMSPIPESPTGSFARVYA
ncbi:hypothetical protein [Schlesneria paludicola]|uniref:hypothetical protein n=1 Tax=Schlesneria paludicola TaxID=360056 RepID=UPI0002E495BE|nr:hypothetical protein [Schlesneria paludicola]